MDHFRRTSRSLALLTAVIATPVALTAPACAEDTFKLGIVTFLSGPAADSFGVPARNGGQFVVDELNKGAAPAPYDKVGFGGMKIEPVVIDENGGATKQVQELRNLYERDNVDVVLGYIGSGDCLAVAPIAEELKKMLVLMDCGTPRIFEEAKYNYVFRTAAHATMDNVGLIRYMKAKNIKMDTLSAINQDYAWGQDSRADFVAAAGQLYPDAKLQADLLPKFGAGQYGTEISALVSAGSDVVYSSLWGGDLQAFILQADSPRPAEAQPVGAQRRRPRAAAARRQDARRHDHRRARRLWPDVAEIAGQRLVLQGLPERQWRLSGSGRLSHRAVDPRIESRGREGDGQERRKEALDR